MEDGYGSFRISLVFRSPEVNNGVFRRGMNSSFRSPRASSIYKITRERGFPTIRWKKGELIGSGAYGRVYMALNLDSGELPGCQAGDFLIIL